MAIGVSSQAKGLRIKSATHTGQANTTQTAFTTVLSISGSGRLTTLNYQGTASSSAYVQVICDGNTVYNDTGGTSSNALSLTPAGPAANGVNYCTDYFGFKNSLVVKLKTSVASYQAYCGWNYSI